MTTNHPIAAHPAGLPAVPPYLDLPSARRFIVALGRIYLEAGLPLAAAFEAAFADYRSFDLPTQCET